MAQMIRLRSASDLARYLNRVIALSVDQVLTDQVCEAWDRGEIDVQVAAWAWCILAASAIPKAE